MSSPRADDDGAPTTPSIVPLPRLQLLVGDAPQTPVLKSITNPRSTQREYGGVFTGWGSQDGTPEPGSEDEEASTGSLKIFASYDHLPARRVIPYTLTMDSYITFKVGDNDGVYFHSLDILRRTDAPS